ncbi:hypothetical protein ACFOHY_07255 [Rhizobium rosettiformans]|uniref:hypothetical protein n=1 Tax=Rhizobium rosettiformans TaxID=1368430 RepID=UPI00361B432B
MQAISRMGEEPPKKDAGRARAPFTAAQWSGLIAIAQAAVIAVSQRLRGLQP